MKIGTRVISDNPMLMFEIIARIEIIAVIC